MRYIDYANIKQGTNSSRRFSNGNTLPLVCLPNALNMFAPQTNSSRGPWFYHPNDRSFEGIRLTHQPSPWVGDFSYFCMLPLTGKFTAKADYRWSGFRPEKVILKPYLMEYELLRYKTNFKLSPTETGAIIAVDSTNSKEDAVFGVIPFDFDTEISVDKNRRTVSGYTCSVHPDSTAVKKFKFYFVITFDSEIKETVYEKVGKKSTAVGVVLANKKYTVRVSGSYISQEQALLNLNRELSGRSFSEITDDAVSKWEERLSRLQIKADEKITETFYSCLYRTFLFPNKFYETDESGVPLHKVAETGKTVVGVSYTNNGFWDTYRTVYPLYSIVCPELINEIIEGYLNYYKDTDVFPKWLALCNNNYMPGNLIESVFADCTVKNLLSKENEKKIYDSLVGKENLKSRKCVKEYNALGYVPYDKCLESVNETLDSAYGDYCISVIAKKFNDEKNYQAYLKRSGNYKNLFDKESGFMRAKDSKGAFRKDFDCFDWGTDYTEASAWQTTFSVPHDLEGLSSLYGGKEEFLNKLDKLFDTEPHYTVKGYPLEIHEMTEMASVDFGQCAISNQPSFLLPYIYAYFGEKQKSYDIIKKITDELFNASETGFPGDEDNGTMSAWYLFSVLGFYPLCLGKTEFIVTGNIVESAILKVDNKEIDLVAKISNKDKIGYFELIQK